MLLVWLLVTVSTLGGVLAGALYVWGFRYMLARENVSPLWGITLPPLVITIFFLFPLFILPAPVPENQKLLFNYYTLGFALPVLVAITRVIWGRVRRAKKR